MPPYFLDTTTLTHLRNGHPRVAAAYAYHTAAGDSVGVTSVNVEEVVGGWLAFLRQARTPHAEAHAAQLLNDSILFLASFDLYAVTAAAVARYEVLRQSGDRANTAVHFRSRGKRRPFNDRLALNSARSGRSV